MTGWNPVQIRQKKITKYFSASPLGFGFARVKRAYNIGVLLMLMKSFLPYILEI